jgi:TonB family protein
MIRQRHYRRGLSTAGAFILLTFLFGIGTFASGQRIAILTPERSAQVANAAEQFAVAFKGRFKVLDLDMAEAAFSSARPETPFNMTDAQSRAAAGVTGSDTLILLRSETLRRASLAKPEYYEAYLAIYVVDGRSGQLIIWDLASFEEATPAAAEKRLFESTPAIARSTEERFANAKAAVAAVRPKMAEVTGDDLAPDVKPPIPYRRIKPDYPNMAYLYGVRATVEVEADIDESGKIQRTAVVRWAGYGLDEAVVTAVRSMNWRPAMRRGKPFPMRVLLRYNFTKIEKD